MPKDSLRESSQKLEDLFFAERDREKLEALRRKMAEEARVTELAAASGIENDEVLKQLHALDIGPDTLAALTLVPLIEVAWADGTLDDRERQAIFQAAAAEGIGPEGDDPAHTLLTSWLAKRPGQELRAAWFEYVRAFCARLSPEACDELQRTVLGRARSVAEATGGFLGLGNRVSPSEAQVLADLLEAFATE
jgi:hypothetical protein